MSNTVEQSGLSSISFTESGGRAYVSFEGGEEDDLWVSCDWDWAENG